MADAIIVESHPPGETEYVYWKYKKLISAVAWKYPGESRFDTALRYIKQAEEPSSGASEIEELRGDLAAMTECAKNHDAARSKYMLRLAPLEAAARDFMAKVDCGAARSVDSYNKFKAALGGQNG